MIVPSGIVRRNSLPSQVLQSVVPGVTIQVAGLPILAGSLGNERLKDK